MSVLESVTIPGESFGGPSISAYVVTTDENKFYVSSVSSTTPVFVTYQKPVIVYDSSSGFGYYEPDTSEMTPLNVVTFAVDENDSSKINLYDATGNLLAQVDAYSY